MKGLDYGCGPSPTLSKILASHKHTCYDYDPLFGFEHPCDRYDYIFSTECFEHFYFPGNELARIGKLLKRRGLLAVMTEFWQDLEQFHAWYYKRDRTHVSFFHRKTVSYICDVYGYKVQYEDKNRVVLLQKL